MRRPGPSACSTPLEIKRRYGVPLAAHETIYRPSLAQPVEHVMGPRASRLSQHRKPRTITGVDTQRTCECGMQRPFRLRKAYGATGRLGPATPLRHQSPITNHLSLPATSCCSYGMNLGPIEFLFQLMESVIANIATGTQLS
jgi:hypothetical protein